MIRICDGVAGGQPCHAERSEASRCPARETLRGVYPERQRRAQGDNVRHLRLMLIGRPTRSPGKTGAFLPISE